MSVKLKKDKRRPVRIQLKKNDQVKVIAGRDRGKTGRVLDVDSSTGRIFVEHVNMIKRHTKKNPAKQIAGGIAEKEASDRGFERDDSCAGSADRRASDIM